MDIFPNNSLIGVDKCQQVWYNVNMIKNTTKKERTNTMNKFNEQVQIEETNLYKEGEVMNEVNNEIQVNDKVKWLHSSRALNQQCFGHVVNAHVKVMGNPCFLIQEALPAGDNRQVMVSKDKVSKAS